jgi:hypothetical protein
MLNQPPSRYALPRVSANPTNPSKQKHVRQTRLSNKCPKTEQKKKKKTKMPNTPLLIDALSAHDNPVTMQSPTRK